jgi:hypothetical protein
MDTVFWVFWTIFTVVIVTAVFLVLAYVVLYPFVLIYRFGRTVTIAVMNRFHLGKRDSFSGSVIDKRIEQNGDSDRAYIVVIRRNNQEENTSVECNSKTYDSCSLGDEVDVTIGNGVLLSFSRIENH